MSRQPPPFPAKRPAFPGIDQPQYQSSTIKPLQINRLPRPSNASLVSNGSPIGPSRPQRSDLRGNRAPDYPVSDDTAQERASRDRTNSSSTTRSDMSGNMYRTVNGNPSGSRSRRPGRSGTEESDMSSPASLTAVLSAFQSGPRKRAMRADNPWDERQQAVEAENATQERIRRRIPGRQQTGASKTGDIDAVLDRIKDDWEFVIDPEFNPVDLALQILDDSSAGKDIESFRKTKRMLSAALQGSVDKHFQAFAAALPHHASLLSLLEDTQTQIKSARTVLQESKDVLGNKRSDLVQMWSRGQTLEEMLRILDQIERLRLVPDVLESLISEKRLLQAAVLLVRSLKTIKKQDMLDIGAVADLRAYLIGQESALRDILIDELHNHLYLKSFWCENRWVAYVVGQQSIPRVEFEDEPLSLNDSVQHPDSPSSPTARTPHAQHSRLSRYLQDLSLRPNDPPGDVDDGSSASGQGVSGTSLYSSSGGPSAAASFSSLSNLATAGSSQNQRNPEADSFVYIETLLESLSVLGKLGGVLDIVAQRLPSEIFALVDGTVDEVSERAEYGRRTSSLFGINAGSKDSSTYVVTSKHAVTGALPMNIPTSLVDATRARHGLQISPLQLRLTALESSTKHADHEILRDLFWTLYSKLDAVMQGLRVVYEVANRIGSRRDFKDSLGTRPGTLFPLSEIWTPVQAEVRTLVNDYLTDEEQGILSGRNPISSINDVLREGRFLRDKSKHVFRFADTNPKLITKSLREHEDELNRVLKDTVPGLVQGSSETAVQATLVTVGTDERLLGTDQHHRLLVKPDAFHISVLFQPTLAFIDRVTGILPSGFEAARASSAVLDEFILRVYLPQLEEKVSLLFHQATTGPEAFIPDAASNLLSTEPLVNASTTMMALINSLCAMLRTTPFHRENYARLILTVIIQFYQRCSDRFQTLIMSQEESSDQDPHVALGAQWAQIPEMAACLSDLYHSSGAVMNMNKSELHQRERDAEVRLTGDRSIEKEDLIGPMRNVSALCNLYRSVSWFTTGLKQLKAVPEDSLSPTSGLPMEPTSAMSPFSPALPSFMPINTDEQLQLPLSKEMALRFHALLKTYEQLLELILHTIRIDVRCRVAHYLNLAMRHGNYSIDREIGEPDPHTIDLNLELGEYHDIVSSTLPPQEQKFVFHGVGFLMDDLLIHNARHIGVANSLGMKKISRNMLALQQCVKTIVHDARDGELLRAKQYYSLFSLSPPDMLALIRKQQTFTFDQYEVMLNLQCGVDQSRKDRSGAQAVDRNYSMYIIDLHGLELEIQKDTNA